ncbi:hypothetical protein AR158_C340L [Paramecium bursaria Chlorella virus AR158]|uniref:hypothetical protein n=1 Tax=Paramecium bursaria Chlorella virus AR158 TaxID=380598 RepID=UPI00015AA93D|nr:hypothetical protein AR158_C340L [Paramecium bursaria Chlorella virus AR158]ABU43885.1 hypothetical protein AR158_C340L [Paramecium bursaria Chlorella virus AR158]
MFLLRLIRTRFSEHTIFFTCLCFAEFLLRLLAQTAILSTTFLQVKSIRRQRVELFDEDHFYICEIIFVTPLEIFYVERVNSIFLYGVSKFRASTTFITMFANSFLYFPRRYSDILISVRSESPYVKIRVIAHRSFEFK